MATDLDKPVLHCFVARLIDHRIGHVLLVTLEEAGQLYDEGWMVVGPDPADEVALTQWERTHPQDWRRW